MNNVVHFVFGIFGNTFALFQFLAPSVTFKRIIKHRSTEEFSGIPYVMTLHNCLITTWYGLPFVSPNNLLISTINGAGAIIKSIYVLIFIVFSQKKEKAKILGLLACVLTIFAIIVCVSLFAVQGSTRKLICGIASTVFSILMYTSPLTITRLVIKTKSVEYMPFFMSLFLFLCGTSFLIFGLLEKDPFIITANGVGFGLGAVQLILFAMYRGNKGESKKSQYEGESLEIEEPKNDYEKPSNHQRSQDERV